MSSAAVIRAQIEAKLGDRIPSAFTTKVSRAPEVFPTGIEKLDAMLQGGVPRGHLTEITGASSTGRTGLSLALVARATSRGAACAWIDVQDALDPVSAAAYGVDLERLLWRRVGRMEPGTQIPMRPAPAQVATRAPNNIVRIPNAAHPRYEIRGMDQAVEQLFQDKSGSLRDQKVVAKSASNRVLDFAGTGPRSAEPNQIRARSNRFGRIDCHHAAVK
jgi:RecA/RadA recombinase